jgi:2-polyprenyl-3-methyl-5-hydroxy-6-metoxy-1,4-benzoquinol methylase
MGMPSAEEIREFYERNPYPAPLTSLDEHRELYRNAKRRRAHFHLLWPDRPYEDGGDLLVAGCGTSQAARYALSEPGRRVTGIDISQTSLRYTADLKRKYRLDNLELRQLSVESISELGRTFDQIVCTGVLHHLPDPDTGLRALRDALHPQGALHLMVYAPYGRVCGRALMEAKLAFEITLDYVRQRKIFRQRVVDFQNSQFKLAEIEVDLEVGRAYLDRLIMKYREHAFTDRDGSICKIWFSDMVKRTVDECLQLWGGAGFMDSTLISRLYTAARLHPIHVGPNEMHKALLGRAYSS